MRREEIETLVQLDLGSEVEPLSLDSSTSESKRGSVSIARDGKMKVILRRASILSSPISANLSKSSLTRFKITIHLRLNLKIVSPH